MYVISFDFESIMHYVRDERMLQLVQFKIGSKKSGVQIRGRGRTQQQVFHDLELAVPLSGRYYFLPLVMCGTIRTLWGLIRQPSNRIFTSNYAKYIVEHFDA